MALLPFGSTTPNASTIKKGKVQLAGDLGGTAALPLVLKINGVTISGTPINGQVPVASNSTTAAWTTPTTGATADFAFFMS